jgi:RNA polymerase sigma-70 factor (family 1)
MNTKVIARYTDEELVTLLRQGDATAFSYVYQQYAAPLFHAAFAVLKHREACEDIIQELFTNLWIKRAQLDIRQLKPYLYAAVRNNVLMVIRSGKVNVDLEELAQLVETSGAADEVMQKDLRRQIDHEVNQLPPKCRTIFMMSREEELSHKEIASQLNISAKTVENQVTIALKRLKSTLGDVLSFLL